MREAESASVALTTQLGLTVSHVLMVTTDRQGCVSSSRDILSIHQLTPESWFLVCFYCQVSPDEDGPCRRCSCDVRGSLHSACVPDDSQSTAGTKHHPDHYIIYISIYPRREILPKFFWINDPKVLMTAQISQSNQKLSRMREWVHLSFMIHMCFIVCVCVFRSDCGLMCL